MSETKANWTIVLLAALVVLAGLSLLGVDSHIVGWEYRLESPRDDSFKSELDRLGKEGWELVFARRAKGSGLDGFVYEMIFKRRR